MQKRRKLLSGKRLCAALFMALTLFLCGCGAAKEEKPELPLVSGQPQLTPELSEQAPEAGNDTSTEDADQPKLPYLQRIAYGAQNVFDGPGYDYGYVMTADIGTYTIVEECFDVEGNLWGKLKSGVGWIDLTQTRATNESPGPISIGFAAQPPEGEYCECIIDASEHAQLLLLRANEPLTGLEFSVLQYGEGTLEPYEIYCTLDELVPEKPLLASVAFYGDMTTYGVSFVDGDGAERHYAISISGRNSSPVVQEYTL